MAEYALMGGVAPLFPMKVHCLLGVLGDYVVPGYRLALLEIHKLAYFLQVP